MVIRVFVVMLLFLAAGCGDGSDDPADSFLFVQNAEGGSFLENSDGSYSLTLNDVSSATMYFADRESRDPNSVGTLTTAAFIAGWDDPTKSDSFGALPPNAVLEAETTGGKQKSIAVRLRNPFYDSETQILRYQAELLTVYPEFYEGSLGANDFPDSFGIASLFIDGGAGGAAPIAGGTTLVFYGNNVPDYKLCVADALPEQYTYVSPYAPTRYILSNCLSFLERFDPSVNIGNYDNSRYGQLASQDEGCSSPNQATLADLEKAKCITTEPPEPPSLPHKPLQPGEPYPYPGNGWQLTLYGNDNPDYHLCISNGQTPGDYSVDLGKCAAFVKSYDPSVSSHSYDSSRNGAENTHSECNNQALVTMQQLEGAGCVNIPLPTYYYGAAVCGSEWYYCCFSYAWGHPNRNGSACITNASRWIRTDAPGWQRYFICSINNASSGPPERGTEQGAPYSVYDCPADFGTNFCAPGRLGNSCSYYKWGGE